LKDNIEEIILNYCCCGTGEYILIFLEFIGCLNEWKEKIIEKNDNIMYPNLTKEQIFIIKEAEEYNKIKLEESIKIRWDKYSKHATRPKHVEEHLKRCVIEIPKVSENDNNSNNERISTPRRRRRTIEI
jgi:hypothetical protein